MRDLREVLDDYERYMFMSTKPMTEKYPYDYVFDENMSVKWNREQVALRNQEWEEERSSLMLEHKRRMEAILDELYATIQNEVGHNISEKQAVTIWNKAYNSGHCYGTYGVLSELDDLIEFVQDILEN